MPTICFDAFSLRKSLYLNALCVLISKTFCDIHMIKYHENTVSTFLLLLFPYPMKVLNIFNYTIIHSILVYYQA
jgi:hypothetical protein